MTEYIGPERRTSSTEYIGNDRRNCMYPGQGDHPDKCPVFNVCIANRISSEDHATLRKILEVHGEEIAAFKALEAIGKLVKKYRVMQ